jgi:hypothetical protein
MPDWPAEIRRRLTRLGLEPWREAEIVEELAQHLEGRDRELRVAGMAEKAAAAVTQQELLADPADALREAAPPCRRRY